MVKAKELAPQLDPRLLLAAIVDSSDDAIVSKTMDGIITSWNDGARRLFGYEAEEVIGQSITILIPSEPEEEGEEERILGRIRKGERIDHYETKRRHKDGHLIPVSLSISPVRDAEGNVVGAAKIVRDMTEREVARTAKEEVDLLRGAVREAEAFSYTITHDLRTPLRAIEGFSRRLLDHRDEVDPELGEDLEFIHRAARQMARTIEGLLQLSRITRTTVNRQKVDLGQLAHAIVAELDVTSPRRVELVVAPGLVAEADPILTRVLLTNLLDNAWKFTRSRENPRVELGASGDGERAFFVRDNGIGFKSTDAATLFQPFHRLNPTSEYEGTGIGLATVRRIVERHGGRAWAEGAPNEGATFHFSLSNHRPTSQSGGGPTRWRRSLLR